jgi:hypothetical protein
MSAFGTKRQSAPGRLMVAFGAKRTGANVGLDYVGRE